MSKQSIILKPIESAEDFKKFKEVEEFLREHNAYILSSIEGEGVHVGRFKCLSLDADGYPIVECDIDKISVSK